MRSERLPGVRELGYPLRMSRNRPSDSSGRAQSGSAPKIDLPALVVMALALFFATLFATLLLLRPDAGDPTELAPGDSHSAPSAPVVNTPSIDAPPVSTPPSSARPVDLPPVSAVPPSAPD